MKYLLYILVLPILLPFTGLCQQAPKATYTHNFPEIIKGDLKNEFVKLFEKGKILYQINCAKCHNSIVDGVETMREFTKEDLAKYEIRVMNPEHEDELSSTRVRPEELYQIMLFLTYSVKVEPNNIEKEKVVSKSGAKLNRKR